MQYDVFIQDIKVGTITASTTGEALSLVTQKIQTKEFTLADESLPANIKLEPVNE